jgi:hypothetical protein
MKLRLLALLFTFSILAAGCEHNAAYDNQPTTVQKSDGSKVEIRTAADGTKTEVRTFPSGEVVRTTRTTHPGGKREAVVEFRDGRKAELKDESDIERALDATGDAIADAARKSWEVSKDVGRTVGDKAEDVAGKTVDTTKAVAGKTADKTKEVGQEIGKGAKKVGKKIKDKID